MLLATAFREELWTALDCARLVPAADRYAAARKIVTQLGKLQREWIVSRVGRPVWQHGLRGLGRQHAEDDGVRVLGFGAALTRFAAAPISSAQAPQSMAIQLGALANFLVATFDHFMDHCRQRPTPLPRWILHASFWPLGWQLARIAPRIGTGYGILLRRLVFLYFDQLRRMATLPEHAALYHQMCRLVAMMHQAELETLHPSRAPQPHRTLLRKSGLPFVVMGLAAWFAASKDDMPRFRWHLAWLYRLGLFFGWIDDAVDLEEDLAARRPNQVAAYLDGACLQRVPQLARRIARSGRRILDEWRERAETHCADKALTEDTFCTCLVSWLGGSPPNCREARGW